MHPRYLEAMRRMGINVHSATADEIQTFMGMVDEYQRTGASATADRLLDADYWRRPPTIREFCEDDYWMGSILRRDESLNQHGLFPRWREELYKVFAPGRQINQIIITGAIGLGKTMVASIALLYKLARTLCLRDPIRYYSLAKVSRLYYSCFSVTKEQIMGGAFQDIRMMMSLVPFFNEIFPVGDRLFSGSKIEFPSNVHLRAGSRLHQALGGNVLTVLIDEINFRLAADAARSAQQLVNGLERRQESRFKASQDTLMILISSANLQGDFLTQHIEKNRRNPRVAIWDFPLWEIRGGVTFHYSGKRFLVDTGDNISPSQILPCGDWRAAKAAGTLSPEEHALSTTVDSLPSTRFIWVPEEHRKAFEDDLDAAIRDIAGIATGRMAKFFPDHFAILNLMRDGLADPFVDHTLRLSVDSAHHVRDALAKRGSVLVRSAGNAWLPRRHPHSPRYLHIDISSGVDALGLVCVHPIYMKEVQRTQLATQETAVSLSPVYELDFALRIVRERPTKEVDFGKIRSFVAWLRDHGFQIRSVSCDLRNLSMEMRGILGKMGFNAPYLSVDMSRRPYDTLKQVVAEQRLHIFPHDYLCRELVNLDDNVLKIDHPDKFTVVWKRGEPEGGKGSKDLSDGLAGAIYMAETDADHSNIPVFTPDPGHGEQNRPPPFGEDPPTRIHVPVF